MAEFNPEIVRFIRENLDQVKAGGAPKKGMARGKDVLPQRTQPTTPRPNTQEVNYQTYAQMARGRVHNPLSEQEFNDLAGSQEPQRFYSAATQQAEQRFAEEQIHQRVTNKYDYGDQVQQANTEFQAQLTRAQDALVKLGQHETATSQDFKDIADTSAVLLNMEGTSDEVASARRYAAEILTEHGARLAPHLDQTFGAGWLSQNQDLIEQVLEDTEPSGFSKAKSAVGGALGAVLEFPLVSVPLEMLNDVEQAWFHSLSGALRATAPVDTSLSDRVDYAKHTSSSLWRGLGSIATFGQGDLGIQDSRAMTIGGEVLPVDVDKSGDSNLREFAGLDPELGGFAGDVADLVGTILLDPTTYASFGSRPAAKIVTSVLSEADDVAVRHAGRRMASGAKLGDLDNITQTAVKSEFLRYQQAAVGNPKNAALVRQNFRKHPAVVFKTIQKEVRDNDDLVERMIQARTDRLTRAAERGVAPAIRIGGRTILPMQKLYNSLGLIDTRLAHNDAWAAHAAQTAGIETPDELLTFIRSYAGQEMPEHLQEQVKSWRAMANRMADDPESWLDDMLQRTATGEEGAAFDQMETFGRELLGEGAIEEWRPWFETQWARPLTTDLDPRDVPPSLAYQLDIPDDLPLRRVIDELDPEKLSMDARNRIQANLDVFDNPTVIFEKDMITAKGLRSVANRDTMIGNMLRRISDKVSPRAPISRTGDLGPGVASQVGQLAAIKRAKETMVTDHVNRLGVTRQGASELWDASAREMGGDADLLSTLTDVLSRSPNDMASAIAEMPENTARLTNSLNDVRQDIFDMSVAAGFDEAILLESKGYLPRTFTEDARNRATRAGIAGSSTAHELPAFQKVGLVSDVGVGPSAGRTDPLEQAGHARGRTFRKDIQDLTELNEEARRELVSSGLDGTDGFDLYEENPVRAMLLRSREAHEAHAWMDMVSSMADLTDLDGRPLAYISRSKGDNSATFLRKQLDDSTYGKKASNYLKRHLPNGGEYYVRKEILDEVESVANVIRDPAAMGGLKRLMTRHNDIWGGWATVPLVGTAFHMRNATGNMFNMMLAGARNPGVLTDAYRLQKLNRAAAENMRETGVKYADALRNVGADQGAIDVLVDARNHGIIGTGKTSDVFRVNDSLLPGTQKSFGRRLANPFSQDNPALQSGRAVGQAIENNARLGLFIDGKAHKGMNSKHAAERVRTYLFDYGDLTSFESEQIRMLSRFYTFTRKNTALQARIMMTQPGNIHNAERITEEFTNQVMGIAGFDEEGRAEAGRMDDSGLKIPDWVQPALGLYRNEDGKVVVAGVDSPFVAGADTVDALAAFLKLPAAWGLMQAADSDFQKDQRTELFRDQLGDALGLLSGGPVEGIKTTAEMWSGQDLFIGGDLSDVDRNWVDNVTRLTDVVIPALGKLDRELEYSGIYEATGILQDPESPDRNQGWLRVLNTLLGMTVTKDLNDPDQITRNMNGLSYELGSSLDELKGDLELAGTPALRIEDFLEMGDSYRQNQAFEFLLYNTVAGEPLTTEQKAELQRFVPKAILEMAGVNQSDSERSEWSVQDKENKIRSITTALQAQGIEVTDQMIDALLLRESGARISDVKDMGIEPSLQTNPYLPGAEGPTEEERQQQSIEQLTAMAERFGISILDLQTRYPLLEPAERKVRQMREAGYEEFSIADELIQDMSRQEKAMLFGEGSLEQVYSYEALTADEEIEFMQKASAAEAELRVIMQISMGRQPTQAELNEWLSEVLFLSPEQTKLGFDNYRPPSRENITPDVVYDERLRQKVRAAQLGSDFLAQQGR